MFKNIQQKEISGMMTILWQSDPFKAKWAILAKAYSIMRGYKSKNEAPLDEYLALTCPHIGIISSDDYLTIMGWVIVEEGGKTELERHYMPNANTFTDHFMTTNLSAEDIVAFCYFVDYVKDEDDNVPRNDPAAAVLSMATHPAQAPNFLPITQPPATMNHAGQEEESFGPSVMTHFMDEHNGGNNGGDDPLAKFREVIYNMELQEYPYYDEFDPNMVQPLKFDIIKDVRATGYAINSLSTFVAPGDVELPQALNLSEYVQDGLLDDSE